MGTVATTVMESIGYGGSSSSQSGMAVSDEGLDGEFLYVIRKGDARLCALCGKWMDGYHEKSKKHQSQLERYNKKQGEEKIRFAVECVNWAAATHLRGGAKQRKEEESAEASSSSGGFAHEAEIGTDESPPSYEYDGPISDRLLALDLALSLAGPALSRSDDDHDGDRGDESEDKPLLPCCRRDVDEDFGPGDGHQERPQGQDDEGQAGVSETEEATIDHLSDPKEGNMILQAGKQST